MPDNTFVPFVEHNEHEGESWTFWLQVQGNEEGLERLEVLLDDEELYEIDLDTELSEAQVDTLVEHGGGGYMAYHHKVTGVLVLPESLDSDDVPRSVVMEALDEHLYKGGIKGMFHRPVK